MEKIALLTMLAFATKQFTEITKQIIKDRKLNFSFLVSLIFGVAIAFTVRIDLLQVVGLDVTNDIVGIVLTGIAISSGSNAIFDIFNGKQEVEVIEVAELEDGKGEGLVTANSNFKILTDGSIEAKNGTFTGKGYEE